MSYAEGTTVPVERTRAEIERLVAKAGAKRFASGWNDDNTAGISFALRGRLLRFTLSTPTIHDFRKWYSAHRRSAAAADTWIAAEARRRWRCLLLMLKGKLEAVESGIVTFDEEFLAFIVTANNLTVWERVRAAEDGGQLLLPPVPS